MGFEPITDGLKVRSSTIELEAPPVPYRPTAEAQKHALS